MKRRTDKIQEPQTPITPKVTSEPSTGGTAQLMDNRTSTINQRKLQNTMNTSTEGSVNPIQRKVNKTGLPDNLKSGIENLSGYSMDDVKVHYNSSKPAQLQAHAYAQGTDIHLASGQEKHLPHEAWHVVQQKQGRVKPTKQLKSKVNINDDAGLEKEADVMGARALNHNTEHKVAQKQNTKNSNDIQLKKSTLIDDKVNLILEQNCKSDLNFNVNGSQNPIQRLVWTEEIIDRKHPSLDTKLETRTWKELGELKKLLKKYEIKFYEKHKNRVSRLKTVLKTIINKSKSIHDDLIEDSSFKRTINMILEDAEEERRTFNEITSKKEPDYVLTNPNSDVDVKFVLHPYAKDLYDEGDVGQGYFGAVDLIDGKVYLLPGYNKVVKKGVPKEESKVPENWENPSNIKETWSHGIKAIVADPLGQNSGQGHVALATTYSLNPNEGNLIGFGIMKGTKGKINQFRNRSSSMNFNSINWENEERISLWRQRGIPDVLSNRLLAFLLETLPNKRNYLKNKLVKNYKHDQKKLSKTDQNKYLYTLQTDRNNAIKLLLSSKTDQQEILASHKNDNDYDQNIGRFIILIKETIASLKEEDTEKQLNQGIQLIESVLSSNDIKNEYNKNFLGIYSLKEKFDEVKAGLFDKIIDYFDQMKEPIPIQIKELGQNNNVVVTDTINTLDWTENEFVMYDNKKYKVKEVRNNDKNKRIYNLVEVEVD